MVATQGPKRVKSSKSKKAVSFGIRKNIPYNKAQVVTRIEFARKVKGRISTKSTKVVVPIAPSGPSKPSNPSPPPSDQNPPHIPSKPTRKGPSRSTSAQLERWLQYREEFSDEFMKHEAFYSGDGPLPCQTCGDSNAPFRCLDCFSCGPSCQPCIILRHTHDVLHRLQKWNGLFFDETSLFELGVSYQLGHSVDEPCSRTSAPVTIMLLDITGVHTVRIRYCLCSNDNEDSVTRRCQLLRARWFPATWSRPRTAFTFRLLDFLHKLQTQSKVNLYDFYHSLIHINNSAGQKPPLYRYNELSLALKIWVHLRQLRRGGGVHLAGGFEALGPGSLSIECPACPHPGKNLVSPHADSWLNTLFLSMDANFKLKQKAKGINDPKLSNGLAYMVSDEKLQDHLLHCSNIKEIAEVSACGSTFNAVSQAHTKYTKGYAVTGVGGVDCARHGFKRPNGVVDLQRGERYSNMDFALMSTLIPSLNAGISRVLVSYDIACQWHKNLQVRLKSYAFTTPDLSALKHWVVVVPKFHLPGHGQDCQDSFNLAYTKWAGRTDGERIEAGWAQTAPMVTWTRESGPNARRAILDDHWNASNWRKSRQLGTSLDKTLRRSHAWSKSQREVATLISKSYPAGVVDNWRKMRQNFHSKPSSPNPYKEVHDHLTIAMVQKELLKEAEDASNVLVGSLQSSIISPGLFFQKAIELEDRIRALSAKSEAKTLSVRQHVEKVELHKTISRSLTELRRSQGILMPGLDPILNAIGDGETTEDSLKLFLPSELSMEDRTAWCLLDVPALEFRFRYAQADDSLAQLCRLLRLFQNLRSQNSKHLSLTQRTVTRTRGLFNRLRNRIRRSAERYSRAYTAMLALDPDNKFGRGWIKRFQKLNDSDVRGPGREDDDTSEGQFTPSWIWLVPRLSQPSPPTTTTASSRRVTTTTSVNGSSAAEDSEHNDSMRAHWAKCQARAERYEEEVELTVEEMGRTLRYFKWMRTWWLSLQSQREKKSDTPPPVNVQRGLQAYAHRQANVYDALILSFVNRWRKTLTLLKITPSWLSDYPASSDPSLPETNPKSTLAAHKPSHSPLSHDCEMEIDGGDDDDSDGNDSDSDDEGESDDYVDDAEDEDEMFDFDFED